MHKRQTGESLTLILLTWRIGWDPTNASKWQMGFNSAFRGLKAVLKLFWSGAVPHVQTSSLPLLLHRYGFFTFSNWSAEMLRLCDSRFNFRLFHPAAFVLKFLKHKSNFKVLFRPELPDIRQTTTLTVPLPRPLVLIIRALIIRRWVSSICGVTLTA